MTATEARSLTEFNKMQILESVAITDEFKNNVNSIDFKIKSFCELGDSNCFFNVSNKNQIMIEALIYYYNSKGYTIKENNDVTEKYLFIKW